MVRLGIIDRPTWGACAVLGIGGGDGILVGRGETVPDHTFTHPHGSGIDLSIPVGRIVADARETLARIPDGEAGLIITDPPWGIHGGGIFDACASYDRLSIETIAAILADGRRALKRGAHLYVFATAGPEIVRVVTAFERYGWKFLRLLAWDKCVQSGMGAYRNSWEPVFVFANGAPKRRFSKHQTYASILRARSIGKRTAKPYELYEVFIEMSSQPGELVVVPFCGTNPLETSRHFVRYHLRRIERLGLVRRTMVRVLVTRERLVPTDDPA